MFTIKPIIWYDVDRISMDDAARLHAHYKGTGRNSRARWYTVFERME